LKHGCNFRQDTQLLGSIFQQEACFHLEDRRLGNFINVGKDEEKVPLSVFDHIAFIFVPTVCAPIPHRHHPTRWSKWASSERHPQSCRSCTLARLVLDYQGRSFLHINNESVLVIEVAVSTDLADVVGMIVGNVGMIVRKVGQLYPSIYEVSTRFMGTLFILKLL
jgi:hypothetical protein